MKLHIPSNQRLLQAAAVLALIALALIVWGTLDPTVVPVMLSMSLGQGIGTLSFVLYLFVIVRDLRAVRALERDSSKDAT